MREINYITVVKNKRIMSRHKLLNNVQKEIYIYATNMFEYFETYLVSAGKVTFKILDFITYFYHK